jgi:hypothetical protein
LFSSPAIPFRNSSTLVFLVIPKRAACLLFQFPPGANLPHSRFGRKVPTGQNPCERARKKLNSPTTMISTHSETALKIESIA